MKKEERELIQHQLNLLRSDAGQTRMVPSSVIYARTDKIMDLLERSRAN